VKLPLICLTSLITAAVAGPASAALIGDAANYNVFVFGSGSFTSQNTDTMGDLAAGGNVTLQNYAVAQGIAGNPSQSPNPARLVVGGTLTATNGGVGSNQAGSIYTNNTPSLTSFTATGGVHPQTVVSSFSADQTQYTNLSTALGAQTTNGSTTTAAGNTLDFTGTSTGLNVFSVAGSQLTGSNTINISAPTGSTVLINVTGTSATFQNGNVNESGVSASSVIYNFYQATSVNLAGSKNPEGSILAPLAGVTGGFGAMNGQLITDSYSGNTQFNATAFMGTLPTPVPLPPALWLLGLGSMTLLIGVCGRGGGGWRSLSAEPITGLTSTA